VVAGDLNAFEDEGALATLEDGATTLTNRWSKAPEQEHYSFAFSGRLQTLDHILVTDGLETRVEGFQYAHFDVDYFERDDRSDGRKVSDHDPPVLTLSTSACPDGDQRPTVVVGDIDSRVPNRDTGDGCTIGDSIDEEANSRRPGQLVRHVAEVNQELAADGVISRREQGQIIQAAARAKRRRR
jgi:hypothetical protein